ncbi:MAG: hypothetical protein JWP91_1981 [Fibrobacteres bacterium]|nr:hypothetical protein [Fibrobacterota bacterium]
MADENEDHLPMNSKFDWFKIVVVLAGLFLINVLAFLVSFGAGVIITLPLTIFLAFLLIRDIAPRHRFPRGRSPQGTIP